MAFRAENWLLRSAPLHNDVSYVLPYSAVLQQHGTSMDKVSYNPCLVTLLYKYCILHEPLTCNPGPRTDF